MKTFTLSAICVIASLTFATAQNVVIDEFPYTTGDITSTGQLTNEGWTLLNVAYQNTYGGICITNRNGYLTSPELKGGHMTVSATIATAYNGYAFNLHYSYDGTNFYQLPSPFFSNTSGGMLYDQTASCELPFGVRYFRIAEASTYYGGLFIQNISITNEDTSPTNTYKNITWTLSGSTDGAELSIGGTGDIPDFEIPVTAALQDSIPWYKARSIITKLTVSSSITGIGNNAFSDMSRLNDIAIPENVTRIGDNAFTDCSGLKEIPFPKSLTHIGNYAFEGCSKIKDIQLPDGLIHIGDGAFYQLEVPTSMYIPNSVTSIGDKAFYSMTNLDYVEIGTGLKSVGNLAFAYCTKLTSLRFNATDCKTFGFDEAAHLASQPSSVFYGNVVLRTYLFGSNVKTIPDYMFAGLTMGFRLFWQDEQSVEGYDDVNMIAIPPTITKIGTGAFYDSRFYRIDIPSSVDTIGAEAFRNITTLSELSCARATPPVLEGGLVFHNIDKGNCMLIVPETAYSTYAEAAQWKDFMFIVDPSYDNSDLRSIAINGSSVNDFESGTYTYSITVPFEVSSITLNAEAAGTGSTVEGVGTFDLNVGLNVFVITVTAANGVSTTVYTMGITRNASVGIDSLTSASGKLRFNNPITDGQLKLYSFDPACALEIYDINGNKLYETHSGSNVVDVSSFAKGVYVVKNGSQVAKVVKQ